MFPTVEIATATVAKVPLLADVILAIFLIPRRAIRLL